MNSDVTVAVTGANGFVGSRVCAALADRGATVRAVVRRAGTAPELPGLVELVGDFADSHFAAELTAGAAALVSTVHPMGSDRATQHRVGVEGTRALAEAAATASVARMIHISTAGVYDRSPGEGDVDERSPLVPDEASDYSVTKRDADRALGGVGGLTRILARPPAILGPGPTSIWNTLRPEGVRDDAARRRANPRQSFAWVHVEDLAALVTDLAVGRIPDGADVARGPVGGDCVAVNVAAEPATWGDYLGAVTDALGVEPVWEDGPVWTGRILADRAHGWGWAPRIDLGQALDELVAGLRPVS